MTPEQLKLVMIKIQVGDNRKLDELVLNEWWSYIGDLDFETAMHAVTNHRRESSEYLQAHHIRDYVRKNFSSRPPIPQRELSPQMQAAYDRAGDSYYWSVEADKIGAAITDSPQGVPLPVLPVLRSPDE